MIVYIVKSSKDTLDTLDLLFMIVYIVTAFPLECFVNHVLAAGH